MVFRDEENQDWRLVWGVGFDKSRAKSCDDSMPIHLLSGGAFEGGLRKSTSQKLAARAESKYGFPSRHSIF